MTGKRAGVEPKRFDGPYLALRFHILPWDLDHTFEAPDQDLGLSWLRPDPLECAPKPLCDDPESEDCPFSGFGTRAPQCDPLLDRLNRLYWDRKLALMAPMIAEDGALSLPAQLERLDHYTRLIETWVAQDPTGVDLPRWHAQIAGLRHIIIAQHQAMGALVGQ